MPSASGLNGPSQVRGRTSGHTVHASLVKGVSFGVLACIKSSGLEPAEDLDAEGVTLYLGSNIRPLSRTLPLVVGRLLPETSGRSVLWDYRTSQGTRPVTDRPRSKIPTFLAFYCEGRAHLVALIDRLFMWTERQVRVE